jgi:hypothetical protein
MTDKNMENWKLKELEDIVQNIHGKSYAEKILEPLHSFHLKSLMAYYHADEYQKIIKEMLAKFRKTSGDNSDTDATIMAIFSGISDEKTGNIIIEAKFKAEAHLIASAQALHSLSDIIATIIYWAFKLDSYPNPPRENKINLYSIKKSLKDNSLYRKTQKSISNITASSEFDYLTAYVNTTKHKSLISSSLSASFLGNRSGILIKEFTYYDYQDIPKHFGKKWSQDFILGDIQKLRKKLLILGNTVNSYLN